MIGKEKLNRFYFSSYQERAKIKKKRTDGGNYRNKILPLLDEMKSAQTGKLSQARVEDFHRRMQNISY